MNCREPNRRMLLRMVRVTMLVACGAFSWPTNAQPIQKLGPVAATDAVGDGATPVRIRLNLDTHGRGELDGLKVDVSAGRVVGSRELEPGLAEVTIIPPRVVETLNVKVEARAPHGQRAKAEIRLKPDALRSSWRTASGPLSLRVPERLILGQDQQVVLTFHAPTPTPVTLHASTGTVSVPEALGHGNFKAVYVPPADKMPSIALIVAATEDGSTIDWAPILLYGRPRVTATSEPHATVLVRVGGEEYGPVRADRRGHIDLRVLVPPGITEAQTIAQDAIGNARAVPLKLGAPAVPEQFAICPAPSEAMFVFAVDAQGKQRQPLDVSAEVTLGTVSPPQLSDQGYYVASVTLPQDAALGQSYRFSARLSANAPALSCESRVVGQAPARIRLSAEPATWVAGSAQSVRLQVHAQFVGGRTPRIVPLRATSDFGEVSSFTARSPELYEAEWRFPARLNGRRQATLNLRTLSARPVQDQLELEVKPGPPAHCALNVQEHGLKADGKSEARLTATVLDNFSNPVDVPPHVSVAKGRVTEFAQQAPGVFVATYETPRSGTLAHDDIEVRVGASSVVGRTRIALTPTSSRLRLWGAAGYATNLGLANGPIGELGGGMRLPWLGERLIAGIDVGYWASRSVTLDATAQEAVVLRATSIPIDVRLAYEFSAHRFSSYLGLAVSLGLVRLQVSAPSSGTMAQWTAHAGASGLLGTLFRVGPGAVLLEGRYRYLPINEAFASGNMGGLAAVTGYLYEF
jgi:hypothetical protein